MAPNFGGKLFQKTEQGADSDRHARPSIRPPPDGGRRRLLLPEIVKQASLGIDTDTKGLNSSGVHLNFSPGVLVISAQSQGRQADCELPITADFVHNAELNHKYLGNILSECDDEVEVGVGAEA